MAIASMTGFAREAGVTGAYAWAWEMRSVNGRGLEVRLRAPAGFEAVGEAARQAVQKRFSRGQCQVGLTLARSSGPPRVRVNEELLQALASALARTRLPEGVRPASVDGLLAVRGVVEAEDETDEDAEALNADLVAAAGRAVEALAAARETEGGVLAGLVTSHLAAIENLVAQAEASPGRRPEAIRARLAAQVALLAEAGGALDPARLHQEAALLATRADIQEEIDRLRAHVAAARDLLDKGGAVGRRLDFLAQEFGREANTLCAKAGDVALSRIGLDLKGVVDQFREQVANVE